MLSVADNSTNTEDQQAVLFSDNAVTIAEDRSSTLYLEQDPSFDLPIFLEVSKNAGAKDLGTLEQFQKRTQAVVQLQHPHIVPILDIGTTPNGRFYTAIEHFSSVTLAQKLIERRRANTTFTPEEAIELISQIADALRAVHEKTIIHQDLRPEKILLNERNDAFLAGFTVVHSPVLTRNTIRELVPVNELDYESPEQTMGEPVTAVSNIYSLGIMLYELLAGERPRLPIGQWQVDDNPQASREIPLAEARPGLRAETYAVVQKCIADTPSERYQTIEAVQADLHLALMAEQVNTDQQIIKFTPKPKRQPKKQTRWFPITIGLLCLAAIAAAFYLMQGPPTATTTAASDASAAAMISEEPTDSPTATPDFAATAVFAAQLQTATAETMAATAEAEMMAATKAAAEPTATAQPTVEPTAVPTATEPPAAIACTPEATILVAYPHEDPAADMTHIAIFFPLNFDLKNSGDCPIAAQAQLVHVAGESFGYEGEPIMLETALAVNEARTLTTTLMSPTEAGTYQSTWQLVDSEENPLSEPFTFQLRTFIPENEGEDGAETADSDTPTQLVVDTLALDWLFSVDGESCELVEQNWRCQVDITPYGGSGGPYQILIFDQPANQATTREGRGPIAYHAVAERCEIYSHELKIIDQVTGNSITAQLTIEPNNFFDCT